MLRYFAIAALVVSFAAPLTAQQQTCNLQMTMHCTGTTNASCTSTTLNAGQNVCTGEYFSGFFIYGTGTVGGFTNTMGLSQCFDSSFFPIAGEAYAFCFGGGSLAPGASFNATASITGSVSNIIGVTGVFDETFENELGFVYAQSGVQVPTCTPVIASPPLTQSGRDYQVTWTTVSDSTAQYVVDESTSLDFSANLVSTQVNGFSRTFRHDVSNSTRYFYRVRPTNCAQGTPQTSGIATTVVQAPPPATSKNPEATVPFGSIQPVSIPVFIPGSASGGGEPHALVDPPFVATTDKPYLSVNPSSGTIPPNGTTVTVTAQPGALPPGASTGTLKVTTNGTTTTNTPISINLVTPVNPTGKNTPPPNALIIPIVTHVNAAAGPFLSDVRLTNASGIATNYQVTLTPTGTDGTTSSKATVVTVGPQETTALNDIVKNFFGFGATGASDDTGFGSLEIRPIDSGSLLTYASSRTYASVALGTFGQFIAAIPFSQFASKLPPPVALPGAPESTVTKLSLQQVAQSPRFRTNFGLAEGSGQPASGIIRIFDAAGNNLKEVPFDLLPGEQKQINGFISANGISTLNDGRIEVEITSATGAVTAYASVLDNVTTDPLAVSPVNVAGVSSTRYTVPGISELVNPNTNFHSDMRIFNGGASDVTATLSFYPFENFPGAAPKTLTIRHGEIAVLDNVLPNFFGTSATGGSIVITTPAASSLVATARTYTNVANNGTFGQFIPGVTPPEGVANGDRAIQILQLEHSDRFRSNLGLVELTGNPVTVRVSLYQPDSKVTPSFDVDLKPNEFKQFNGVIRSFLGPDSQTYNARVSVQVISGSGRVSAYGSVIDNQSADPTYVPAQ